MTNIKETAIDVLNRCKERTLENGFLVTEEPLDEKFAEHLWTSEFKIEGETIRHEFFLSSERSGIVQLDMHVVGGHETLNAVTLTKFYFKYLSVHTIAAAVAAIVERG